MFHKKARPPGMRARQAGATSLASGAPRLSFPPSTGSVLLCGPWLISENRVSKEALNKNESLRRAFPQAHLPWIFESCEPFDPEEIFPASLLCRDLLVCVQRYKHLHCNFFFSLVNNYRKLYIINRELISVASPARTRRQLVTAAGPSWRCLPGKMRSTVFS